jgi:hypothetical protein
MVPLYANRFLVMMSEVAVAWLLLDGAVIAHAASNAVEASHPDAAFYTGKVQAALYYARTDLPNVEPAAARLDEGDRSPLDVPEAGFATV